MPNESAIIDFDNAEQRKQFVGWVKSLRGMHNVRITKSRHNRTLPQNSYYWGVVLPRVVAGLEEAWGESITIDEAHEWLKAKFNVTTIVNRNTGEVVGKRPASTANLDTKEFGEYMDKVIQFAAESLNVEVPQPT